MLTASSSLFQQRTLTSSLFLSHDISISANLNARNTEGEVTGTDVGSDTNKDTVTRTRTREEATSKRARNESLERSAEEKSELEKRQFPPKSPYKKMKYGMFISSFDDGVLNRSSSPSSSDSDSCASGDSGASKSNNNSNNTKESKTFLQYSTASVLTKEYINQLQKEIEASAKYSPCAGPNIEYLNLLQTGDDILQRLQRLISSSFSHCSTSKSNKGYIMSSKTGVACTDGNSGGQSSSSAVNVGILNEVLGFIRNIENTIPSSSFHSPTIKILYIPTAMYALKKDSINTPGKQRQRARRDAKERRDKIVQFVETLFETSDEGNDEKDGKNTVSSLNTLAVTLDLDDGSIKHPVAKGYRFENKVDNEKDVSSLLPKTGKESLTSWNPHLIYVEGGNTFWLQHCIDKGDWSQLIIDACSSSNENPAMYIGKSAGAIVAGKFVETATWKRWDDPSVVPGRETYEDWKGKIGLNLAGGASFFPHMSDDFDSLVEEKRDDLNEYMQDESDNLFAIREEGCCFIFDDTESTSS
jgi:peptidase E